MARVKGQARLPYILVDVLAQMHASIDPDSGHILCHYHDLGAAVVEVGGREVPMLLVGGCLMATADPAAVEAVEAESRLLESIPARFYSNPSAAQWLSQLLQLAHELSAQADARMIEVDGVSTIAVVLRNRGMTVAVLLAPHCVREFVERGERRGPGLYL